MHVKASHLSPHDEMLLEDLHWRLSEAEADITFFEDAGDQRALDNHLAYITHLKAQVDLFPL